MKVLVGMLLAVIATASSTTANAADTLRIVSYRDIELCGSERRWLIAATMGAVKEQDSLQSFDITIGYDTSIIRPTDGLIVGTLADQMRFGDLSPIFNFTVPGEIRVGGFTVTRNVNGNLPLFAVAGSYNGTCGSETSFTFPWPLEFNPEFKKNVTVVQSDTIRTKITAKADNSQGPEVELDTVLMGLAKSDTIRVLVQQQQLNGYRINDRITMTNKVGTGRIATVLVPSDSLASTIVVDTNGLEATVSRVVGFDSTFEYGVVIERLTTNDSLHSRLQLTTELDDSCGCIRPTKRDTVVITGTSLPTHVDETVLHEGAEIRIDVLNNIMFIQNHHGQPADVRVLTVQGRLQAQYTVQNQSTMEVHMNTWAEGVYIVHIICDRKTTTKKITK